MKVIVESSAYGICDPRFKDVHFSVQLRVDREEWKIRLANGELQFKHLVPPARGKIDEDLVTVYFTKPKTKADLKLLVNIMEGVEGKHRTPVLSWSSTL